MKASHLTLSVFVVLSLAGCASTQVRTDYDEQASFARLKTYDWIESNGEKKGMPGIHSALVEERIRSAVEYELAQMGYRRVVSGAPDFRVAHYVIAEEKLAVTTFDRYYGYGYSVHRHYGHLSYAQEYVRGTLILDIIDAESNDLIWRGWATKALDQNPKPASVRMYVDKAVRKILRRFPPTG